MNSSLYQQLLTTYFAPHLSNLRHLLFYPDNIPLHKTPAMLTWFEENRLELIDVPAYSHEFNTVVYVWSWLKNYMQKQQSKNKLELEPAFDNGCESIPRNSIFSTCRTNYLFVNKSYFEVKYLLQCYSHLSCN